jgi:hypothetical protein
VKVKLKNLGRSFPSTIVLFRDGVGEGQFEASVKLECRQLMRCFKEIDGIIL